MPLPRQLIAAAAALACRLASAWEGHAAPTAVALSALPEVAAAGPVAAEPLESFVAAERARLGEALEAEERWARAHVPRYPARPDALRFSARDPATPPRVAFLEALRLNPTLPLGLYLQRAGPGASDGPAAAWGEVGILPAPPRPGRWHYRALHPGEQVRPLEVVASASDEPDLGSDLGLFDDTGTPQGARYGLGPLPFGNPRLVFGTQAPFHMGLYHESGLVLRVAPSLARTFPEVRLHQCATLAHLAFATGHRYWGWRFLGWGLHYAQDLTQPYHARAVPGVSTARLLLAGALDALGVHGPRTDLLQLVTNRHLGLEAYQFEAVVRAVEAGDPAAPLLAALRDAGRDAAVGPYDDAAPRQRITAAAWAKADRTDAALEAALPARWVSDPRFTGEMDPFSELRDRGSPAQRAALEAVLADLLADLGAWTRAYTRAVLSGAG